MSSISKPQNNVQLVMLGEIAQRLVLDSRKSDGSDQGGSIKDHCFSVLVVENSKGVP